jgi:hypothetical protein
MVSYRVLPTNIETKTFHIDSSQLTKKDKIIYIGHDYSPYKDPQEGARIFNEGLEYDGSFARGISFGNSQSLVLNSNFNLQIAGDLGDDLKVQGVISDENIPIQPEGNTQTIQEFDKVYIQINKDKTELVAGDYEVQNPNGYFMRYFKKLKGLQVSNQSDITESQKIFSTANFASSRGKFARNELQVQEGNQGPYKLQGNNGEVFFFVLAGTEKVYLDGKLLERGIEKDYVIEYNLAELSFTAKQLITKDVRLIIEFEYTDQSYNRTQYGVHSQYSNRNLQLSFAFYSEQDSKGSTSSFDLDSLDLATLETSGDQISLRNGIRPLEDEALDRVLYDKIFEPSISDSILLYSETGKYIASFSDFGAGNGAYIIDNLATANGRVYKWVGLGQGRFEPVIRLVAPEKRQMISLGLNYQLTKNGTLSAEMALSELDLNRFSSIGNSDNQGLATQLGYRHSHTFGDTLRPWQLSANFNYEFAENDFNPLNPYRSTEFNRDWNFVDTSNVNEHIGKIEWILEKLGRIKISHSFNLFNRQSIYDGSKQNWLAEYKHAGFSFQTKGSYLNANTSQEQSQFFRPSVKISQEINWFTSMRIGASIERESNKSQLNNQNELLNKSFFYEYYKAFIEANAKQKLQWRLSLNRRVDKAPAASSFQNATLANELQIGAKWANGSKGNLNIDFTLRDLQIESPRLSDQTAKTSYLGKLDFNYKWLQGAIRTTSSYLLNNGQEAKLEFTFQEVQEGRGDFIWIDADSNSVQSLNEFLPAPFADEANYIRVRIFNNEFINTNNIVWTQSLRLEPRLLWKNSDQKTNLQKTISLFSWIANFRINQRTEEQGDNKFSPFHFDIQDSSLVAYNSSFNQTLFFNRGNPGYDLQFNLRNSQNKFEQITGFELNTLKEYNFRARLNIRKKFDLIFTILKGKKEQDSELFSQNDFIIDYWALNPELNWRPTNKFRYVFSYSFDHKKNLLGEETADSHDARIELSWRQAGNSRLNSSLSLTKIDYTGKTNTTLELAILEGLKNGNNFLWNIAYTRRIASNLDVTLNYEGRKTGDSRTVHLAKAQIKASF